MIEWDVAPRASHRPADRSDVGVFYLPATQLRDWCFVLKDQDNFWFCYRFATALRNYLFEQRISFLKILFSKHWS